MSKPQIFIRYWLPVLALSSLIFVGSTDVLSANRTSRFIGPFLRWLMPSTSDDLVWAIQAVIRKGGHLTEYAVLAWLWWRALRRPVRGDTRPWDGRLATWAVVLAGLYAVTDEWHQSFISTRLGSPWDVLIDTVGAALGMFAIWSIGRWRKRW